MKKAFIAILIVGLAGAAGFGVYYYYFADRQGEQERVSSTSEDAVYVDLVSDITGYGSGNGRINRYGGEVEPQETLEVKLESDRTVEKCFVKEGDEVKEGQRLFVYDTQEDEDKLAEAQIEIEKSEGNIEVAKKSIEENEKSRAKASADEQLSYTMQILADQNSIKQEEYSIKTKKREIEQLQEGISNATVTAEMDGIIQSIQDPNNASSSYYGYSSGNETAYITILSAGDYRIKGKVNEQNMNQIYEGMEMIVHSRVDESITWKGSISEIKTDKADENSDNSYYYSSDGADSSSYAFYVELENSEGLILGQHVYLEEDIGQGERKDGLWLDEYYIEQEDDAAYVWRASEKNVLEKHEVTLGEYDEEQMKYEITDGLAAEDYITMPQEGLAEGIPVIYNDYSADDFGGFDDAGFADGGADDGMYYEDGADDGMYYEDGADDGMFYEDGADDGMYYEDDQDGGDDGDWLEGDLSGVPVYEEP